MKMDTILEEAGSAVTPLRPAGRANHFPYYWRITGNPEVENANRLDAARRVRLSECDGFPDG